MTLGDPGSKTYRRATIAWALVLIALHAIPRSGLLRLAGDEDLINSRILDKFAHALIFGMLGVLADRGWPGRTWAFVTFALAFGAALEVFQGTLVPGRSASAIDWVCDTLGASAGWYLGRAFRRAWSGGSISQGSHTP
jgi:VanZ family protein